MKTVTNKTLKISAVAILALALVGTACKKKESASNAPTPVGSPPVNPLTAVYNGTNFTTGIWYNNGFKDIYRITFSKMGNRIGVLAFQGDNVSGGEGISIGFPYGVGTYSIAMPNVDAKFYGYYTPAKDTITSWDANAATITITAIDTIGAGSDVVNRLKGTFSFTTSVYKNKSFTVTNGVIDYTK
jgi:hypothetical protein